VAIGGDDVTAVQQDDAVDILLAQHQRIKDLFGRVAAATGVEKRELFEGLVCLLAVHEVAEEELVHPLARRKIEFGQRVVDSRLHEERQAKRALADLYNLGTDQAEFDTGLEHLRDMVLAHAEREEHDELPYLREAVPPQHLQRLASVMLSVEKRSPTRPHPNTPSSATGNVLLGPPLSVFDRVRDAVRDARERIEEAR
jgi:hypothetical protein